MESRGTSALAAAGGLATEFNPSGYPMLDAYHTHDREIADYNSLGSNGPAASVQDWENVLVEWEDNDAAMDIDGHQAEPVSSLSEQATDAAGGGSSTPAPARRFTREQKYHSEEEWDSMKEIIRDLYIDRGYTLATMSEILFKDYGFVASPKMFKSRLDRWGFHKNLNQKRFGDILRNNAVTGRISKAVQEARITKYVKRTKSLAINLEHGSLKLRQSSSNTPTIVPRRVNAAGRR